MVPNQSFGKLGSATGSPLKLHLHVLWASRVWLEPILSKRLLSPRVAEQRHLLNTGSRNELVRIDSYYVAGSVIVDLGVQPQVHITSAKYIPTCLPNSEGKLLKRENCPAFQ